MKNKRYYNVVHEWPDPNMQDDDLEFPIHWFWRIIKYKDPSLFYLPWLWFIWPDQQYPNRDSTIYELQLKSTGDSGFRHPWGWSDYFAPVAKEMERLVYINKTLSEEKDEN